MVLSTALFREIKKKIPNSKITLICSKLNLPLIEKNNHLNQIKEIDIPKGKFKILINYWKMSRWIKKQKFDVGIDLRGSVMNSFFLLWFPQIQKRISRIDYHPFIKIFLTTPIKMPNKIHATDENIRIVEESLGIKIQNSEPEIITNKKDKEEFEEFYEKNGLKKYVCMCPLAGLENKQWPLKRWEELIKKVDKSYQIILLGVKGEEKILKELSDGRDKCQILIDFDLRLLSLLFGKSSLVIAQDGGPMHIAWVSGAKVIEITSKTNPIIASGKYFPLNHSTILIASEDEIEKIRSEDVLKESSKIILERKRTIPKILEF